MKNTCFLGFSSRTLFVRHCMHPRVLLQGEDAGGSRLSCSTSIRLCMSQWYVLFKYANVSKNGTRMDDCTVWHLVYAAVKLSYVMSLARRASRAERPSQLDACDARSAYTAYTYRTQLLLDTICPLNINQTIKFNSFYYELLLLYQFFSNTFPISLYS